MPPLVILRVALWCVYRSGKREKMGCSDNSVIAGRKSVYMSFQGRLPMGYRDVAVIYKR